MLKFCTLTILSITLSTLPSLAADEFIGYGSRAGMDLLVTGKQGIGTQNAIIRAVDSPKKDRQYCVEYAQDYSKECVTNLMKELSQQYAIRANCDTGELIDLQGDRYHFKGRNPNPDDFMAFVAEAKGEVLDGSNASGYPLIEEHYARLCPGKIIQSQ